MAAQLLVLCLMVGVSAVSGQGRIEELMTRNPGQDPLTHGPNALRLAARSGERVIIRITRAGQVAFMQEAVQASIDCLPWLMNFPGGTIQWYRELYNDQGMPRDDRGPQLVTSSPGVRVIGGRFNRWFNITSIKITQDERDNDYGLHICEVCVARGTPLEMCHNATLNVYVAGAPPVILKAGDVGPPLNLGQFRIGSTICYDAAMNQTFSFVCNLNDNPPIAVPPPTYEWKFNDRVIFRSNTSAVNLTSPEYLAFLEANPLFGSGIVNPVMFLPQTREIIILDTEVFNITMPVMGLTPPLSSEEREMVRRALIGSYTCTASNVYGSDTATTNFRMCGDSPAFPGCSAPTIFVANGGTAPVGCNVCIPEGSSVTLDCTVSVGTPPITYAWSGPPDGNVISNQPRLTVNTQGDYNCTASNLDDPSGAMGVNLIIFSPSVKFSGQTTDKFGQIVPGNGCDRLRVPLSASETPDMCVFVGDTLNLTCLDSENRQLNTTLMNGDIFTSPSLITRANAAMLNTTYRCSLNTEGPCGQAAETISVMVYEPAVVDKSVTIPAGHFAPGRQPQVESVMSGSTVTLNCPAQGIDDPSTGWTRVIFNADGCGVEVDPTSDPDISVSTQGMNVLLMIANYNETRHGGSYVCRTNNAAGADAASVAISSAVEGGVWSTGDWSDCNVECRQGTRVRSVTCVSTLDGRSILPDSMCPQGAIPPSQEECTGLFERDCFLTPIFVAGEFGPCSKGCAGGFREREVSCVVPTTGLTVPNTRCFPQTKPRQYEFCPNTCCVRDNFAACRKSGTGFCNSVGYQQQCCWTCLLTEIP